MGAAPDLEPIFQVIEGGKQVAFELVSEVTADSGAKIVDITSHTAFGGNGSTTEVAEVVETAAGATSATTTGVAFITQAITTAGPAIAVALGLAGGYALYNLAPEDWDLIAERLTEAGQTVGGKVAAFMNNNGKTSYSQQTIEIVKNGLLEMGVFQGTLQPTPQITQDISFTGGNNAGNLSAQNYNDNFSKALINTSFSYWEYSNCFAQVKDFTTGEILQKADIYTIAKNSSGRVHICGLFKTSLNFSHDLYIQFCKSDGSIIGSSSTNTNNRYYYDNNEFYAWTYWLTGSDAQPYNNLENTALSSVNFYRFLYACGMLTTYSNTNVQEGATIPTGDPFPLTYPTWDPNISPTSPLTYPVSQPFQEGAQPQAQTGLNPNPLQTGQLSDLFYNPQPQPDPEIRPDPDVQPEPDPLPDRDPETPETDPKDPNKDPEGSGTTPVIPPVATTASNRLFTVYNPTDGQLDSLGAFLWSNSIVDQLVKIWQNPIDGVIALHKVYCTPTTSGNSNIILGYIDSNVSSAVVSSQFVEVDCGSVTVPENKENATDYSPFTQIQIYLPFIGIQELETNEIMGGSVNVKYKIDVYTGTCIAMIFVTRSKDMSNAQLLYTFSGNCSQKLPLTASDFSGAIASLLGIVGIGVASGGSLGVAAGALGVAHSLTSDMVHIQHSGGLSANSGILAPRTPFIIISRQQGYDANGYGNIYGFPANKTVYLSNCSGFVRVKSMNYTGAGTQEEKQMIEEQLKRGVLV